MVGNFAFTLYEIFGYLLPGGLGLLGFLLLYWAIFVPKVPLGIANFQPGLGTWTVIVVTSYVIGHAWQAIGNKLLGRIETSALAMRKATWMHNRARERAAELAGVPPNSLEPRWTYRILDEYAVQVGQAGDRDMFIYREGFYRATCISLFFVSFALVVRSAFPGTSIQFTRWMLSVSVAQLLTTAAVFFGLGWLFLQRYRRFAEYRVTRAVLVALILQKEKPTEQQHP